MEWRISPQIVAVTTRRSTTCFISGVTRYGSGGANMVVPRDTGNKDGYTIDAGKFLGWGVRAADPS